MNHGYGDSIVSVCFLILSTNVVFWLDFDEIAVPAGRFHTRPGAFWHPLPHCYWTVFQKSDQKRQRLWRASQPLDRQM